MRGDFQLAMKLPVQATLRYRNPSNASEIDGIKGLRNGAGDVDVGKRVNDLVQIEPPSTLSSICNMRTKAAEATRTVEVHPITIRKTPRFPSRDRHLAIRRKKATNAVQKEHQPVLKCRCCFCALCCDTGRNEEDEEKKVTGEVGELAE